MKRPTDAVLALVLVAVITSVVGVGALAWGVRSNHEAPSRMGSAMMTADRSRAQDPMRWASEPEYLAAMIAHHHEAVAAAGELVRSERAAMRSFAEAIIATQSAQVRQMQVWLQEWYPGQALDTGYRPMMRSLSGLSGDRLDVTFLQDMIDHHMAAVMMSQHLLLQGTDHDEIAHLARSIRDDQHAEIVQMQRWLAQCFDVDWLGTGSRHGSRRC